MREQHAQLGGAQPQVHPLHVVRGAIGPGLGEGGTDLPVLRIVKLRAAGVDDAPEIEPDDWTGLGHRRAWAQGLVTTQRLSAPLANELVGNSVAICAQNGYTVTADVVDLDGVRQALLRGNGAPIHTLDNAFFKAYSAASLTLARKEDSTKAVAERMAKSPATTVPQTTPPNVTYAVGGVTIMAAGA